MSEMVLVLNFEAASVTQHGWPEDFATVFFFYWLPRLDTEASANGQTVIFRFIVHQAGESRALYKWSQQR